MLSNCIVKSSKFIEKQPKIENPYKKYITSKSPLISEEVYRLLFRENSSLQQIYATLAPPVLSEEQKLGVPL